MRTWQKILGAVVHDRIRQVEIYKCLWLLMMEPDQDTFQRTPEGFLMFDKSMSRSLQHIFKKIMRSVLVSYMCNYMLHLFYIYKKVGFGFQAL